MDDARNIPPARLALGGWDELGAHAQAVRTAVFVVEQAVPPELELDEHDAVSIHAVAYDGAGRPIGTGRLLPDGHVGRMAVRRETRGRGVGSRILLALAGRARELGYPLLALNAQTHAVGFYERHGFVAEGPEFLDAGIPHRLMTLPLAG